MVAVSISQCHLLVFRPDQLHMPDLSKFVRELTHLGIPQIDFTERLADKSALDSIVSKIGSPGSGKAQKYVMILGAYLEKQISVATQHMLHEGYPVILLRDLGVTNRPEHAQIHDLRLQQSGAVATTSEQLIYEWATIEQDGGRRDILNRLILECSPR